MEIRRVSLRSNGNDKREKERGKKKERFMQRGKLLGMGSRINMD